MRCASLLLSPLGDDADEDEAPLPTVCDLVVALCVHVGDRAGREAMVLPFKEEIALSLEDVDDVWPGVAVTGRRPSCLEGEEAHHMIVPPLFA